jgi:hypothetical protein
LTEQAGAGVFWVQAAEEDAKTYWMLRKISVMRFLATEAEGAAAMF